MKVLMLVMNDMTADPRVMREAAALGANGHEVTVLALRSQGLPEVEQRHGYSVERVAGYSTVGWGRPLKKARQHLERGAAFVGAGKRHVCDVVHVHDTDTLLAGVRIAKVHDALLVYDAHELYPDMAGESAGWRSWFVQRYWRDIEKRYVPRAETVITVSEGRAAELSKRYGVQPVVLRNLPELQPIKDTTRLRREIGALGDERPLFLYQGVLIPGRGLIDLIRAVAQVPDVLLVIQGYGQEEQIMKHEAARLGITGRIWFMGKVDPASLHEYACGADAGIVTYLPTSLNNRLAAPNKLFGYMMAGIPVIASDTPEVASVLAKTKAGVTFTPGDSGSLAEALARLAADPLERASMGANGRRLAEREFSWDIEKRKLLDVYDALALRAKSTADECKRG